MPPDPRRVVGALVTAKAIHVTSEIECHRRFGHEKKTTWVVGVVTAVNVKHNEGRNRTTTTIVADYDLGFDTIRRKELNLVSVKPYVPPEPANIPEIPIVETPAPQPPQQQDTAAILPVAIETQQLFLADDIANNTAASPASLSLEILSSATPTSSSSTTSSPTSTETANSNNSNSNFNNNNTNQMDLHDPVASPNNFPWYDNDEATKRPVNGPVYSRDWQVQTTLGEYWSYGCNTRQQISRLEVFLQMFPPIHLQLMVRCTNLQLQKDNKAVTTGGEILKYFGILILITKFEFSKRSSLWSATPIEKYEPAPNLGRTGMSRKRFDELTKYIRYSQQPEERPDNMNSEQYRWMLVNDFITNFNNHRASNFRPSNLICVDESMS